MADSFVQLPDDSTNTGKKIRTITRVVGIETVHEHFFIVQDSVNDTQLRIYTEGDTDATIAGTAIMMEGAGDTLVPAQGTVADGMLVNLGANNDVTVTGTVTANAGTGTFAISAAALPLPTGAATAALQTQPGIDIGDVTINNAAGASAVNIQDGGNTITVDGTITANLAAGTNNIGDVDILSVVPGTGATNLGKAEDAGHTSGDVGVMFLGVRNTANSTLAGTDADYAPIAVDIMSGAISGVRRSSTTLTAINTTYNTTSTETNNSAWIDCSMFRKGYFYATVTETGAATDITFTLQFSNDGGTTEFDYRVGPWVKYRFDDATIAAHDSGQLKICEPFDCAGSSVRMKVIATGLSSGVNEFVVANASFELVN